MGRFVVLVRLATNVAVGPGLACEMYRRFAVGAELAFSGKCYIASANLAPVTGDLHRVIF